MRDISRSNVDHREGKGEIKLLRVGIIMHILFLIWIVRGKRKWFRIESRETNCLPLAWLGFEPRSLMSPFSGRLNARDKMAAIFQKTISNTFSWMIMYKFRLKFDWGLVPINNNPALVQIMAWRRSGDKPLSKPMLISLGLNELTRHDERATRIGLLPWLWQYLLYIVFFLPKWDELSSSDVDRIHFLLRLDITRFIVAMWFIQPESTYSGSTSIKHRYDTFGVGSMSNRWGPDGLCYMENSTRQR